MAASSQYHRGAAATVNSHHRQISGGHEHMYANLATAWNGPQAFARVGAPSAYLQRYIDYYAGPSDYVNHQPPAQHAWPASHLATASQPWTGPPDATSYPARQLSYVDDEARATVPHASPPARQLHHESSTAHTVPYSGPGQIYHPDGMKHDHQPGQVAAPTASSFQPQAPNLAPVASLLNYPNSSLHVNPAPEPVQAPESWPSIPTSDVPPTYPTQHPTHAATAVAPDIIPSVQAHYAGSGWGMFDAEASNTGYEQVQHSEPEWQLVETLHPQHQDLESESLQLATLRDRRKVAPKKNLAKVTAAFTQRQRKLKVSKRSGPLPEASRLKTHKMRKERATCIRCRFYKAGCDEGEPCQRCYKILGNARSFMLPCTRDRLEDANLVRHCNGRSNQEEGEFFGYDWLQGSQLYLMDISWNLPMYGPISPDAPPMRITFREYWPSRQLLDTQFAEWTNAEGVVQVIKQPAYAIYDTASFLSTFERYFSSMQPAIEAWIFHRVRDDEIAMLTYREVMRVRSLKPNGPTNLLDLVMRIQCLSVVSQGYGTIATPNIPGVNEYDFGKMGRSTYEAYDRTSRDRPLTNAITHQMDVAALKYLKKLEGLCHKELKRQMFKAGTKPWYEVFLALYVLFWNMEYIHHGAKKYIMAKNGTQLQQQVSSVVTGQLKKWDFAVKTLMYHWMAVLRDFYPLKLARENPEELRLNGHVDAEGFAYLKRVVHIIDAVGFGRSTVPYVGPPSTHDTLSSDWLRSLFEKAFGPPSHTGLQQL